MDHTKELIVFEDSVGMKKEVLGIYQNKDKGTKISLCYKNSSYRMNGYMTGNNFKSIIKGNFVPSKVSNTKDLYIISFPIIYGIRDESHKLHNDIDKNLILYYKYNHNSLLFWDDLLDDKKEKENINLVKDLITKL